MATRLERLLGIENVISSGSYPSLRDLCALFSVRPRTIYEDIRILRVDLGLDIQFDRSRNGYYNANPGAGLPSFDLSFDEFSLLVLASESLCGSLGSAFNPLLNQALKKISRRLRSVREKDLELLNCAIRSEYLPRREFSPQTFSALIAACVDGSLIRVEFQVPAGEMPRQTNLFPCCIVETNRRWQLLALDQDLVLLEPIALASVSKVEVIEKSASIEVPEALLEWLSPRYGCLLPHKAVNRTNNY